MKMALDVKIREQSTAILMCFMEGEKYIWKKRRKIHSKIVKPKTTKLIVVEKAGSWQQWKMNWFLNAARWKIMKTEKPLWFSILSHIYTHTHSKTMKWHSIQDNKWKLLILIIHLLIGRIHEFIKRFLRKTLNILKKKKTFKMKTFSFYSLLLDLSKEEDFFCVILKQNENCLRIL